MSGVSATSGGRMLALYFHRDCLLPKMQLMGGFVSNGVKCVNYQPRVVNTGCVVTPKPRCYAQSIRV